MPQTNKCCWYAMYQTTRLKFIHKIPDGGLRKTIITAENIVNVAMYSFHRSTIFVFDFNYFYAIID